MFINGRYRLKDTFKLLVDEQVTKIEISVNFEDSAHVQYIGMQLLKQELQYKRKDSGTYITAYLQDGGWEELDYKDLNFDWYNQEISDTFFNYFYSSVEFVGIDYVLIGGTLDETLTNPFFKPLGQMISYGDFLTSTKVGYDFKYWQLPSFEDVSILYGTNIFEPIQVTAIFKKQQFKINYITKGGIVKEIYPNNFVFVDYGSKVTSDYDYNCIKEGYKFLYWSLEEGGNPYIFGEQIIEDDITLYANYNIQSYTINVDMQGGTPQEPSQTRQYNQLVSEPVGIPTKEGYIFIGWSKSNIMYSAYDFNTPVTHDLTLYAYWRAPLTKAIFYQNNAEDSKVNKENDLVKIYECNIIFKDSTSILNPIIKIVYNELPIFNYCYINTLNRYYYITNIVLTPNNFYVLYLSCDELMSFKNEIGNLEGLIARNEFEFDPNLNDNELIVDNTSQLASVENLTPQNNPFKQTVNTPFIISTMSTTGEQGSDNLKSWEQTSFNKKFSGNINTITRLCNQCSKIDQSVIGTFFANPNEYISSIMLYPFEVNKFFRTSTYFDEITIGKSTFKLENYYLSNPHNSINIANFKIEPYFNSYLDYQSQYKIYIPFFGYFQISPQIFMGYYIKIDLSIDFDTGQALLLVKRGESLTDNSRDVLITTQQGKCGVKIPIGSDGTYKTNQELLINNIKGLIDYAVSMGAFAITGNPIIGILGGARATSSMVMGNINALTSSNAIKGETSGNVNDLAMPFEIYMLVTRPVVSNSQENYKKLLGLPLNKTRLLKNMKGYTKVKEIHIENLSTATQEEKNKIYEMLLNGVIM